jgi:hypothetical protein
MIRVLILVILTVSFHIGTSSARNAKLSGTVGRNPRSELAEGVVLVPRSLAKSVDSVTGIDGCVSEKVEVEGVL